MIETDSTDTPDVPREPIHRLTAPIASFLHIEAASGGVLLAATAIALIAANSSFSDAYLAFWKTPLGFQFGDFVLRHSLLHWINDALMVVFFFVIGLEVKRELVLGELRDARRAALPIAAALGGMVVPAGLYLALMGGGPASHGWGIPMATDIAFVVGCMAVLGPRVPHGLRVLLLSLAIADDIGAILVIAIGYTDTINLGALALGAVGIAAVSGLQRLGVRNMVVYVFAGMGVWYAFHESGVHATLTGVILGMMTPARAYLSETTVGQFTERASALLQGGGWESVTDRAARLRRFRNQTREAVSPLEFLENTLHPWMGFVIMPIFALANAGVPIALSAFTDPVALSIGVGLVIGKPLGIVVFSFIAVRLGVAQLPVGVGWPATLGGGALAGIGFTMALFIAGLALEDDMLDAAKVGILAASALAAVIGLGILLATLPAPRRTEERGSD